MRRKQLERTHSDVRHAAAAERPSPSVATGMTDSSGSTARTVGPCAVPRGRSASETATLEKDSRGSTVPPSVRSGLLAATTSGMSDQVLTASPRPSASQLSERSSGGHELQLGSLGRPQRAASPTPAMQALDASGIGFMPAPMPAPASGSLWAAVDGRGGGVPGASGVHGALLAEGTVGATRMLLDGLTFPFGFE